MPTVAVTCIKNGRSDSFGQPLVSGNYYPNVEKETAKALWMAGFVSVADTSVFYPLVYSGLYRFNDLYKGRVLSSLLAGSLATRVGDLVTISSSAHGLPSSGVYNGSGFFFPGCPSLDAGWYSDLQYISASSISFRTGVNYPGANFAGESINSGAIYNTRTSFATFLITREMLTPNSRIQISFVSDGGGTAATKSIFLFAESTQLGRVDRAVNAAGATSFSIWVSPSGLVRGMFDKTDGQASSFLNVAYVANDGSIAISLEGAVSATSDYLCIPNATILVQ